ncbi:MAG: glycosyltransferase family 2 protein [Clostridia bacterium]|nr:glycosyltransferase family 2 protein [Clostridia bacterium]
MLEWLFWVSLFAAVYSYFIYPVVLYLWSRIMKLSAAFKAAQEKDFFLGAGCKDIHDEKDHALPNVSLIISCYNEAKVIRQKLENTLNLNYPPHKLQIIVASDGSTDDTVRIAEEYTDRGVEVFKKEINEGKTVLQNNAVKMAKGEILVFSDGNSMYDKDAVLHLVHPFKDSSIGVVCGELNYRNPGNQSAGKGEGLYWKYEKMLKVFETATGNILGANGSIYAVRKEVYIPLPPQIISDFVEPLKVCEKNHRIIYQPQARCIEETSEGFSKEFARKVRIITRSLNGLYYCKNLLNPFSFGELSFKLISHKLLRWLVPVFLIQLFILNLLILNKGALYMGLLVLQIMFYLLSLAGLITGTKSKPFYIPAYFFIVNYASILGIYNFITGKKFIHWQPVRASSSTSN